MSPKVWSPASKGLNYSRKMTVNHHLLCLGEGNNLKRRPKLCHVVISIGPLGLL